MKGFTDLFVCAYATDSSRLTINHLTRQPPRCRITGFMESRAWGDLAHELTADGYDFAAGTKWQLRLKQEARKWASKII